MQIRTIQKGTEDVEVGVCLGARVLKLDSSAHERMSRIQFVPFFVEAF